MPVELEYVEEGIFLSRWVDEVTMDDVFASQKQGIAIAEEKGIDAYVVITDMSNGRMHNFDFAGFRRMLNTANENLITTVIYGASPAAKLTGNTIGKLLGIKSVYSANYDEALIEARRLVTEHKG